MYKSIFRDFILKLVKAVAYAVDISFLKCEINGKKYLNLKITFHAFHSKDLLDKLLTKG